MQYYSAPFRIGRTYSAWDSQSLYATIVGILVAERLQIAVEYAVCQDEQMCYMGVNNCIGWQSYGCDQIETAKEAEDAVQAGSKLWPDVLSDLMFVPEIYYSSMSADTFAGTELVGQAYEERQGISLGPSGYTARDGLFIYPESVAAAWANDTLDLLWLGSFRSPLSVKYLATPQAVIDAGIQSLYDGCTSDVGYVAAGMAQHLDAGWSCNSSWWLTEECASHGERWTSACVVMFEDDLAYDKPELTRAVGATGVPVAKLFLGYDGWREVLIAKNHLALFTWWTPDASLMMHRPRRVAIMDTLETPERVKLKAAWRPAMDASSQLMNVLSTVYLDNDMIKDLMQRVSKGYEAGASEDKLFAKVACDWLWDFQDVWEQWLPSERSCMQGQYFDETAQRCEFCPIGTFATAFLNHTKYCKPCEVGRFAAKEGLLSCDACPGGKYQDEEGRSACSTCAQGTSQGLAGQTACTNCTAGSAAGTTGLLDCMACSPGTWSPAGAVTCSLCEVGSFAATMGTPGCVPCPGELTTVGKGAASTGECVCPAGSYRPPRSPDSSNDTSALDAVCDACPEGLSCLVGSDAEVLESLRVLPGYMTRSQDPFRVFKCLSVAQCPGGALGTCAPYRSAKSVACGVCEVGAYERDNGCQPCTKTRILPILLGTLAAIVVVGCGALLWSKPQMRAHTRTHMEVMVMFGLAFSCLQTLTLINTLDIGWPEPMNVLFQALGTLAFDIKVLRVSCMVQTGPSATFIMRQSVPLFPVPFIALTVMIKKRLKPATEFRVDFLNTVGAIYNVFFISIFMNCTVPFVCYPHPSGNGASVLANPSVLCFQSPDHHAMVAAGTVSFFVVPLPFLVFMIYGIARYRHHASRAMPENVLWLRQFRFMFSRFRPEAYFYGVFLLARSCTICLVPVILTNAALQICAACVAISAFTLVQQQVNPWRSRFANLLDGFLNAAIINLLLCGAMVSDKRAQAKSIAYLGMSTFAVLGLALLIALVMSVVWHVRGGPKYEFFLCHHKVDAQAQARLLKIKLQAATGRSVFLDSDDLVDLHGLFDIVQGKMRTLLVYLTRCTLMRPWCAGEITTALNAGRQVVVVRTPSFVDPTEEQLADLSQYIDLAGCNLAEHDLTLTAVAQAFRRLLSETTPCINVEANGFPSERFQKMLTDLSAVVKLRDQEMKSRLTNDGPPKTDMLVISVYARSNEAWAASSVLVAYILQDVLNHVFGGITNLADRDEDDEFFVDAAVAGARAVVVVLSRETLQCALQLQVMSSLVELVEEAGTVREAAPAVIPMSLPGFEFPSADYYETVFPKVCPHVDPAVPGYIKAFFQHICVSFPTGGSEQLLVAQSRQVLARIPTTPRKLLVGRTMSHLASGSMSGKTSVPLSQRSSGSKNQAIGDCPEEHQGCEPGLEQAVNEDSLGLQVCNLQPRTSTRMSTIKEAVPLVAPDCEAGLGKQDAEGRAHDEEHSGRFWEIEDDEVGGELDTCLV